MTDHDGDLSLEDFVRRLDDREFTKRVFVRQADFDGALSDLRADEWTIASVEHLPESDVWVITVRRLESPDAPKVH